MASPAWYHLCRNQPQQGVAVPHLAKWAYNLTTNYDGTKERLLKGVTVGGGGVIHLQSHLASLSLSLGS